MIDAVRDLDTIVPELLNLGLALIFTQRGHVVLHGGAVARGSAAAVIMGPSGAGKSSLVLAAGRRDLTVISDEIVPLVIRSGIARCPGGDPRVRVAPAMLRPRERKLCGNGEDRKAAVDLRRLGIRCARGPRRAALLLFLGPRFAGGRRRFLLRRLSPAESLVRAIDNTYTRRVLTRGQHKRHLRALAELARTIPCYELAVRAGLDNLDAAALGIDALLAQVERGPAPRLSPHTSGR